MIRPRIGELFSGYGGLGMGARAVLGGSIAWHSEIDTGACRILERRYPGVPNLGDITTVPWEVIAKEAPVDVLTGGFPCQDVSHAGKRLGIHPDSRSGLWTHMAYAISQLRPPLVVIENVRGLLSAPAHGVMESCAWCVGDDERFPLRALGAVLGDLADLGYDASWAGVRASDVGAPHSRFRVFVAAWPTAVDPHGVGSFRGQVGDATRPRGRRDGERSTDPDRTPQDADGAVSRERRDAASDETQGRWARADTRRRSGAPAPDTASGGRERRAEATHSGGQDGSGPRAAATGPSADTPADPDSNRRQIVERFQPRVGARRDPDGRGAVDWGAYDAAIHGWERTLGRPAPAPTEPGRTGPRLSPAFVEWLMGLPDGWVTDVPGLTRNDQLKALGNGVVPQQAAHALRLLLADTPAAEGAA